MELALTVVMLLQDFKQEDKPDNLRALMQRLHRADAASLPALAKGLLCDEARLRKALKDDAPKEFVDKAAHMHKELLEGPEDKLGQLRGRPEQGDIRVHSAKTGDIAAYAEDSTAWKHFAGGTKKLAERVLRPGTTYHVVEFLQQGRDKGYKLHLFFWDGERWAMLGPVWRFLD